MIDNSSDLSKAEVDLIIEQLAVPGQKPADVKKTFDHFFNPRMITMKAVHEVKEQYKKDIEIRKRQALGDIDDHPLAYREYRLNLFYKIFTAAMEEKETAWQKTDEGWKPIVKQDLQAALRALEAARQEIFEWEKIELAKERLKLEGQPAPIQVDGDKVKPFQIRVVTGLEPLEQ